MIREFTKALIQEERKSSNLSCSTREHYNSFVERFAGNKWIFMVWSVKHCWLYVKTLVHVRQGFGEKFQNDQELHANIDSNFKLQRICIYTTLYTLNRLDTLATVSMLLRNPRSLHRNLVLRARLLYGFSGILNHVYKVCIVRASFLDNMGYTQSG